MCLIFVADAAGRLYQAHTELQRGQCRSLATNEQQRRLDQIKYAKSGETKGGTDGNEGNEGDSSEKYANGQRSNDSEANKWHWKVYEEQSYADCCKGSEEILLLPDISKRKWYVGDTMLTGISSFQLSSIIPARPMNTRVLALKHDLFQSLEQDATRYPVGCATVTPVNHARRGSERVQEAYSPDNPRTKDSRAGCKHRAFDWDIVSRG